MGPQLGRKHLAVSVTVVLLCCVCADEKTEAVKAREGANVTLQSREPYNQGKQHMVVWTYGPKDPNMRIATVKKTEVRGDYNKRFRDRLQLDSQTGALTITTLRATDSGTYMYQSIGTNVFSHLFNLTVYSSVRPPSIKVNASSINTSCSSATVECYVENSRELVLSWYRGRDRLKQTSSPDLSSTLSLSFEIESHDGDNYSCVAANPLEEKATKLQTEDTCLKNRAETSGWCETEATVRLAISAVVGLALIILVVDHIRLRR